MNETPSTTKPHTARSDRLTTSATDGGSGPKPGRSKPLHLIIATIALAVGVVLIAWQSGWFDPPYANGHPGLRWRTTFPGAAGGPWTLALDGLELTTVSPANQTLRTRVRLNFESGGTMRMVMDPPHPQLGSYVTLTPTNPARVALEKDSGFAEVLP